MGSVAGCPNGGIDCPIGGPDSPARGTVCATVVALFFFLLFFTCPGCCGVC
jgi:hypothetical protein